MPQAIKIAAVCSLTMGLAACSTVSSLWPFGGNDENVSVASDGERIPILEIDQQLAPSTTLSAASITLPPAQPVSSYPSPGGPAGQPVAHAQAAENFAVAWRRDIGAGASRTSQVTSPVVADGGRIFVMDGEATVSAVDANTGQVVWRTDVRPDGRDRGGFGGGVAVGGGKVFAVSGYRVAVALDQATGQVLWTQPLSSPIHGAPTVSGGRVYAVDVDNQLIAFDANTGEPVWTFQGISETARILRASSPVVAGDSVIAPFSSGELVALSAANGQQLWQQVLSRTSRTSALSEIRDIAGRPVVAGGFVYAISHSGVLGSIDVRTGQPRWTLPIAGVNAPLPVGSVVYVVSNTGMLSLINQADGQVYWSRDLNEGRERKEGGFIGIGDRIVSPQWSGPILASNRLILVNSDGEAVAFDPRTGAQTASIRLGGAAYIAPIPYNGALYVLTDDGQLVSIR